MNGPTTGLLTGWLVGCLAGWLVEDKTRQEMTYLLPAREPRKPRYISHVEFVETTSDEGDEEDEEGGPEWVRETRLPRSDDVDVDIKSLGGVLGSY